MVHQVDELRGRNLKSEKQVKTRRGLRLKLAAQWKWKWEKRKRSREEEEQNTEDEEREEDAGKGGTARISQSGQQRGDLATVP